MQSYINHNALLPLSLQCFVKSHLDCRSTVQSLALCISYIYMNTLNKAVPDIKPIGYVKSKTKENTPGKFQYPKNSANL